MFKKVLAAAAVVPMFWFTINADGAKFCPTSSDGTLVEYSVLRPNDLGEMQTLTFGGLSQSVWCSAVAETPAR